MIRRRWTSCRKSNENAAPVLSRRSALSVCCRARLHFPLTFPDSRRQKAEALRSVSRPDNVRRERSQSLDTDRASATLMPSREWLRLVLVYIWGWLRQNLLSPAMFLCLHLPHDCFVLFGLQPLAP